jgi:hypothetical protein
MDKTLTDFESDCLRALVQEYGATRIVQLVRGFEFERHLEIDGPAMLSCAKCGVPLTGNAVLSWGDGPEAGKSFFYCSKACEAGA